MRITHRTWYLSTSNFVSSTIPSNQRGLRRDASIFKSLGTLSTGFEKWHIFGHFSGFWHCAKASTTPWHGRGRFRANVDYPERRGSKRQRAVHVYTISIFFATPTEYVKEYYVIIFSWSLEASSLQAHFSSFCELLPLQCSGFLALMIVLT